MSAPQNLQQLVDLIIEKIEAANQPSMPEQKRVETIADAVYAVAFFMLQVTPTNGHHQVALAAELVKRLRLFRSPFLILPREIGDDTRLRELFENFLTTTADWRTSQH